ncbi:MAG: hypothetical protein H6Q76_751 [Firmicutes bacterium]|nr:hypothetical protein [Bacillota bacterium]
MKVKIYRSKFGEHTWLEVMDKNIVSWFNFNELVVLRDELNKWIEKEAE